MEHELRAEYTGEPPGPDATVKIWHVVRQDELTAMCGRDLAPGSAERDVGDWGRPELPVCHSCGALYLREVP